MNKIIKFLSSDKVLHYLYCFYIYECLNKLLPDWISAVITIIIIIVKELYDYKSYVKFCLYDTAAGCLGLLSGIVI